MKKEITVKNNLLDVKFGTLVCSSDNYWGVGVEKKALCETIIDYFTLHKK